MNRVHPDGRVFDARGRFVGRVPRHVLARMQRERRRHRGFGQVFTPSETIGAKIFEFFHPGTVQREYEAVGKDAPSTEDIMTGAAAAIEEQAAQGVRNAANAVLHGAQWIIVGLVALGVIVVFGRHRR